MEIDVDVHRMAIDAMAVNELIPMYQLTALSNFARRAKTNAYWTKLIRADFYCGDTAAAAAYSLKYGPGMTYPLTRWLGFGNSQISRRLGALGNLGGACYQTGIVPSTYFADASSVMLACGLSWIGIANATGFGTLSTGLATPYLIAQFIPATGLVQFSLFSYGIVQPGMPAKKEGFYVFNRKSAATVNAWKDGAVLVGDTADASGALPDHEVYYLARNNGNGGQSGTDARWTSTLMGINFTDADCINMSTDHAILMRELRRAY